MRNLLSQEDKKILRNEYKLRIATTTLIFLFFTILAAGGELLPSYFISAVKERATKDQVDIIKKSVARREKDISSIILLETKEKLKLFELDENNISLRTIFEIVLNNKPSGVKIDGIFYNKNQQGKDAEISITGDADRREPLLEFKRLLGRETQFTDVLLPLSNLASDKNIRFSIKITGNF